MRKADLNNGDIVLTRNGDKYIVLKNARTAFDTNDIIVNLKTGGYLKLNNYNDDLKDKDRDKKFDIMKVCSHSYVGDNIKEHIIDKEDYWTWEREEPKEMTVDEISEKLGYKVKVVGEDR